VSQRWWDTSLKIVWRHFAVCHGDAKYQLYLALFIQSAWLERSDELLNARRKRRSAAREASLAAHPGAADRLAHVKTDDDMQNRIHLVLRGRSPRTAARAFALPRLKYPRRQ
jgi:hypothetical protein